jgi:hypothetical protein
MLEADSSEVLVTAYMTLSGPRRSQSEMYYLVMYLDELRKTKIVLWLRYGPFKCRPGM